MSDNLSIDEIIKRAQQIKNEAEKQLQAAEKSLDEKAKQAIEEVVVDEEAVAKRIAKAYEKAEEEEDIKVYVPSETAPENTEEPESIDEPQEVPATGKTVTIDVSAAEEDEEQEEADDNTITFFPDAPAEEKTIQANFVSTVSEKTGEHDLEPIPTIVSTQHVKTFNSDSKDEEDYEVEVGVQIKFDGFDENIDTVEKIDEKLAEKELEKRREEKVGKFRLFGPDETDDQLGDINLAPDEYDKTSERDAFLDRLISRRSAITAKLMITLFLFIPLILMAVFKENARFPLFLSSHTVYFSIVTAIYVLTLIFNYNVLAHGFNFKKGINADTPVSIAALGVLAHTVLSMLNIGLWYDNGVLLAPAAVFALFMSQLGKRIMMNRLVLNFDYISNRNSKYTVENIANNVDAEIISRGVVDGDEPVIKSSVKCDFPTNFLEISCKSEPADNIARRIFIVDIILSVLLLGGVIFLDNLNTAVNAALSGLVIALPISSLFISNILLGDISSQLSDYDAVICGYEGAYMTQDADAVAMEAADLFANNACDFHGVKTFGGTKVDDAIIYAAAVMIQTKSPLAHVFDDIIIGKQSILPKVEGITYEEKMGTSAWIYKKKVLVGTREMMKSHDVSVPQESFENKYTIKDRKALYLALDGKLLALFVVSYNADPDLKRELRKLEKSGIALIVKSADPYINEESLRELFSLPEGFIHVMNYSAARVYDKYSNLDVETSPAYVVHGGTALGLVSAMRGAGILVSARGLTAFLLTFGSVLGFAGIALLSAFRAYGEITALAIIIYQIIWTVFMYIVTKFRSIGL